MPTCTALKAAKAGVILQKKRGLPAINVPDSVVSSIWQAAESSNVGSVHEGVDQALQGSQGNMCHRVGLDCRIGILQRSHNPLQSVVLHVLDPDCICKGRLANCNWQ